MAQITTGVRKILSMASVYNAFQTLLGATNSRTVLCNSYIRAKPGETLLDVGCGPARILDLLPSGIQYFGLDLSPVYIASARAKYGERGTFLVGDIAGRDKLELPPCDVAIAIGILHHLDDSAVDSLFENLHERLVPGGRLITFDGAYWPDQNRLARKIISMDRGQNVRPGEQYRQLATRHFKQVDLIRRDDLLRIPYTHAILRCIK